MSKRSKLVKREWKRRVDKQLSLKAWARKTGFQLVKDWLENKKR